jgi:hypothetical protein
MEAPIEGRRLASLHGGIDKAEGTLGKHRSELMRKKWGALTKGQ